MIYNGDENRGVLTNWLNELAVTGVATPVQVDTGGAIVYGMPYQNTAAVNVAVPSPTSDTRQDYIVLRRNWADQEIRITRIAGVEGGGVPAMTQSPAPSGTGIYDIPLATLSTTTGGVITVTDAREYCLFGGVPGDNAFDSTQITNGSIDWPDRETRTKRYFLPAGALQPVGAGDIYNYQFGVAGTVTTTAVPTWGGGANNEGWQINAAGYEALAGKVPWEVAAEAIEGSTIYTYVWWVANSALASTFYIRTRTLSEGDYTTSTYSRYGDGSSTYINETTVQHQFYRTVGCEIDPNTSPYLIDYILWWYNSAGAEDISIMGVEFVYEGYV